MSVTFTRLCGLWVVVVLCCSIGFVATVTAKTNVAPDVSIRAPAEHLATNQNTIEVIVEFTASANPTGKARPPTGNVSLVTLTLNGTEVGRFDNPSQNKSGTHTFTLDLAPYPNGILTLQAFAYHGNPKAGPVSTSSPVSFMLDRTPPVITAALSPAPNPNNWNNSDVTVSFAITDNLSGVAHVEPSVPVVITTEKAGQKVTGTATDKAGNMASTTVAVNLDKTAPDVAITAPAGGAFFNVPVVTLTGTVSDDLSGVAGITCHGIAAAVDGSSFTCDVPLIEGANVIEAVATDNAGNIRTASIAVTLDTIPPVITATTIPSANAAGWHNTPVTVSFDCTDSGSGVATCPSAVPVETEGANQAVGGTATDRAGNSASVNALISLDTTAPGVALTSPPDGATLNTPEVNATGTASDALSSIAGVSCNGSAASLSTSTFTCSLPLEEGANPINAEATDKAGNVGTAQITVTRQTLPVVTITAPANLSYFNISPTTVTGTVDDPTATVTVNAIPAAAINGHFSVAVPLAEGPNLVTASAITPVGAVGSHSLQVTLDTTPPHVTITSPPDSFITTDSTITVAGIVNDIVVGTVNDQQAQVSVNNIPAQVANRTFLATAVPLALGDNVIQTVASDRVGNAATTQITVTRQVPSRQAKIQLIAGNNQTGMIGSLLPSPLVVALTDAVGNPAANQPVIFKVIRNNGLLAAGGPPAPTVIATTDAQGQGQAQVQWTLGARAGAGANTVEAYAVGFEGTAMFSATGTQSPAANIVVDSGNEQIGAVNQPLPRPLIAVVVDSGNNRLAGNPVTFSVIEGGGSVSGQTAASVPLVFTVSQGDDNVTDQSSVTVITDADGRAAATWTLGPQAGNANNRVQANFPSNPGHPASFTASGRVSGDPAQTTISGVVLDNSDVPIPGVTVRAVLTNTLNANVSALQTVAAVETDAQGQFMITQAPVGFVKLLVDGSTAQRPGEYPSLEYDLVTVSGQDNTVGMPIHLLPLNPDNQLCVTAITGGGTLTIPEAPGFSLTFGPGQVTFPGGSKTGCVSVTVVHGDKVPMVPGFGQQPRFIVTIQPAGVHFEPPAVITLPNVDGLAPGEVTELYSFDHDLGQFVAIGTGTVSEDGTIVRSDPGVGIIKGGWHCGGNPAQTGSAAKCAKCKRCVVNQCVDDPGAEGDFCRIDGNQCTLDKCNKNGRCNAPLPDGVDCNDDCLGAEGVCESGVCKGLPGSDLPGFPERKSEGDACDDGNSCTFAQCKPAGVFELPPGFPLPDIEILNCEVVALKPSGTACETDDPCIIPGTGECTFDGRCLGKPKFNECQECNSLLGTLSNVPDETVCNNPSPCFETAMCIDGMCTPQLPKAAGTPCEDNDGKVCTTGACDGTGQCVPTPVFCPGCQRCVIGDAGQPECIEGCPACTACDEAADLCLPLDCSDLDGACTVGVCDPSPTGSNKCEAQPNNQGASCDDGFLCTTDDVCMDGICGGTIRDCSAVADQCNMGACIEEGGTFQCTKEPKPNGMTCDDGFLCTVNDVCMDGVCGGTIRNCSAVANQCNLGVCDEEGGTFQCIQEPRPDGTTCNDGLFCTVNDVCSGGTCGGAIRDCSVVADQCNLGVCVEALDQCVKQPRPNGTPCNDSDSNTFGDVCIQGLCNGVETPAGTTLRIDEVVTSPQSDWSDSSGTPFDSTPGSGAVNADDEYIEIRNTGGTPVQVRDLVLRMIDAAGADYVIGSSGDTVEVYSSGSDVDQLLPGGILVIGNPPGAMDNDIAIEIVFGGPSGFVIADVLLGGPGAPSGASTSPADEAVIRVSDTGNNNNDFIRGPGSPGL